MAYVYANLIREGVINPKTGKPYTILDVPIPLRDKVQEILDEGVEDA